MKTIKFWAGNLIMAIAAGVVFIGGLILTLLPYLLSVGVLVALIYVLVRCAEWI